jgi:hypothetical protein
MTEFEIGLMLGMHKELRDWIRMGERETEARAVLANLAEVKKLKLKEKREKGR